MDNLMKEEAKQPARLNFFTQFDQNDTKFFTQSSVVLPEPHLPKAPPKILFSKDFGLSFQMLTPGIIDDDEE